MNAMTLQPLVPKLGEYDMERVSGVERMVRIKRVGKMEKVKEVEKVIKEIK